jgi:hypothetical protein
MHTINIKIDTPQGMAKAEKKQTALYSKYNHVNVVPLGIDAVQLQAWN